MSRRLVQLLGAGIEELWYFPEDTEDGEIEFWYREFLERGFESFDEYMEEVYPSINCERVWVDEIYIN